MVGCRFHFCQATLNWVRKNGLNKAYEEGERDPVTGTGRYNPSKVLVLTDKKLILEGNGDQPPRRKKRHVTRDRRIAHLVEAYDRDQVIPYLDSLRNVMVAN